MNEQCCESVREPGTWPRFHRCMGKVKVIVNGNPYCAIHDPERTARRRAESEAKFQRDLDADRIRFAGPLLLAALQGLVMRHMDGSDEAHWAEWDTAREAIAKATGAKS